MVVTTTAFETLTRAVADRYHLPGARIVVVEHPLGGIPAADVLARADRAVTDVITQLTTAEP